ncbi:MAG: YIP1 family protein [Armatimonadetes bacterium]|nr:YIP1 family protein [Armatimonadota bacterium]
MHSKPKLALCIITNPQAAFEEILQRRLLADAFVIVGLTGFAAMLGAIARGIALGPTQLFVLGRDNPLTWIGLWMLYSLVLWGLLRWVGNRTEYENVLMVLGWSHTILLLHQVLGVIWGFLLVANVTNRFALQFFSAIGLVLPIMYLTSVTKGLQTAGRVSFGRAAISFVLVLIAGLIALDMTYAQRLMQPFLNSLPGIALAALRFAPMVSPPIYLASLAADPWVRGAEQLPRLAAGVVGLAAGLWVLGKSLGWDDRTRKARTTLAAIAGAALLAGYLIAWSTGSYYNTLVRAQRLINTERYEMAASALATVPPCFTDNKLLIWGQGTKALLIGDIADIYYEAGKPDKSIEYQSRFLNLLEKSEHPDKTWLARGHSGIGAACDIEGNYDQAIAEFETASKAWPEFKEPWVRMAVTYDRMGRYRKAIESANHAIKKLDSDAPVAWVALVEAFVNIGDIKQAKAAMANLAGLDPDLAARIGNTPADWKSAVTKLTVKDLKFPLEKQSDSR